MTFKKSVSLMLVLTLVLGLFSTGVFVSQAQASETETTLRQTGGVATSDLIPADGYVNTNSAAPASLKYYLIADLNGTRYYFQNNSSSASGMKTATNVASATPVTLAVGKTTGTYRIAYWNPASGVSTNYSCLYANSSTTLGRTRLNGSTVLTDFNLNADGTFYGDIGTGRVLVCKLVGSDGYMGFVDKATVEANPDTYAYVYLAASAGYLSNEAPEGYKVSGNLPLGVGDQVNNLYAGVNVNGTFNVVSSTSTLTEGMRYFSVTSDESQYPTSSLVYKPNVSGSEGYMVVFGITSGDAYAFAWDSTAVIFNQNRVFQKSTSTSTIPASISAYSFAAKHSFSYNAEDQVFTHSHNGTKYILGMKATDTKVQTYTYAEAIIAAATADTTDDIFPLRLYEKVSTIRYNVQLNSVLRVKFYVPTAEAEGMTVTVGGTAVTATQNGTQTIDSVEHAVYYVDVMAQDMLKPIVATVSNGNTKIFTLKNYIAELAAIGSDDTVNNLANAALVYCQYAAANKYPDTYSATADVTVPEGALSDYTITKAEGSAADIGLNAYLDEACDLQVLIPVSYAAGHTVIVDGKETAVVNLPTRTINDTEYYVAKVSSILPQDYGTSHTFVVKNGDATVYEAEASVLAYINHCLTTETGTEAELNLMSAMFHYWYDAVTYTTGTTPESLQLEAFTIVADSANAELANTLAANIQSTHGIKLAVNTDGTYTGNRAIYLGTDKSYNSYGGYRYNISTQNGSIYINGTKEGLVTGANALVSSIQDTNMFPFGLDASTTGYEWYTSYNTDSSILRTSLGYTLKSYERMADLAPGVEMYKLTYTSPNTVSRYCISCGRSVLFDGEACNGCGTVKPNYKTAYAYAVVLRNGSDAKFQMVTAGYDPTKEYTTDNPAPTDTVYNLAATWGNEHSEYQILAITNGGFARHDEGAGTEVPWGMQIVDGVVKHAPMTAAESGHARSQRWFGVYSSGKYKVGDAGDSSADRTDYTGIQQGVNGSHYIFKNGRPTPFLLTATQDDHTMICHTKNDDMVLLTMTNCNSAMAAQAFMDLSLIAGNLDIYEGINLDGGGSTGMYYAVQGSSLSAAYVSDKDGHARTVSDAVAIVIPTN